MPAILQIRDSSLEFVKLQTTTFMLSYLTVSVSEREAKLVFLSKNHCVDALYTRAFQ